MGDGVEFKVIWSDAAIADVHDICSPSQRLQRWVYFEIELRGSFTGPE
jgi:hypothetical protein